MPGTVPLLAALALLALPTAALARDAVDLALVLAVDISGSIDAEEAAQQREGYVSAIADPQVIAAIRSTATGRITLTYVEWSGADSQQVVIPWTVIDGAPAAEAFAGRLAETPTHRGMWTSISGAIDFAVPLFGLADVDAERRAIDVSGDGVNNRGRPVTQARDEAVARGIVINGLPIMNDCPNPYGSATPVEVALDRYYAENVIGGPGSFIVPAPDFTAFKAAILRKLILEIAGEAPAPLASR